MAKRIVALTTPSSDEGFAAPCLSPLRMRTRTPATLVTQYCRQDLHSCGARAVPQQNSPVHHRTFQRTSEPAYNRNLIREFSSPSRWHGRTGVRNKTASRPLNLHARTAGQALGLVWLRLCPRRSCPSPQDTRNTFRGQPKNSDSARSLVCTHAPRSANLYQTRLG